MTVCPIKKKMINNLSLTLSYKYFLTFVVYLVMTRMFVGVSLAGCRLFLISCPGIYCISPDL